MNLFPEHINLYGTEILVEDLLQDENLKNGREAELTGFLKEWYSNKKYIEVKTSGSTGKPKTIRLQKKFVADSAQRTLHFFELTTNDRILHCLPMQYIAGKLMGVRALLGELELYLTEPTTDFTFLEKEKFRFAAMVPNQVAKILQSESAPGELLGNIEKLLIGGSSIPVLLEDTLQYISTDCYSSYGMTETATHIALKKINGANPDSWYHCLENIRVELSAEGCLQIYLHGLENQPLQTTDLAELKDEKTFQILGRIDYVIISGGIKFSPEQLEKKLESFIFEPFMISSLPHESLGQQLILVVKGKESKETVEKLKNICRQHLDKYEQPRQIVFETGFPRTKNGKIDRKNLKL